MNDKKTALGIELGSTRIKAVLINENFTPIASASHEWENKLENGFWTYSLDSVWAGLQDCIRQLNLEKVDSIGISAMMHGYMAFDKNGDLLVPFRTWRNTTTEKAAAILTEKLGFNIPQRWSVAHLYQAILNNEPHVKEIDFITTLAGFVHWKLTGQKVLGVDDASGMFPINTEEILTQRTQSTQRIAEEDKDNKTLRNSAYSALNYNKDMMQRFDELVKHHGLDLKIENILPKVLLAGENAGTLTEEGAKLLDPSGKIKAGVSFCPPEGDAGTGMVATNAIAERTGNVSAGTSVFAMIVMEKSLSKVYPEIDIVATPTGKPVAMVHCNNCTGDLDAFVQLVDEAISLTGAKIDKTALYTALYNKALEGDSDCGGLLSYNYISGEQLTGFEHGRPLLARLPDSNFNVANLMKTLLFSSMATLKMGMDILFEEKIKIDSLLGHGGLFKIPGVAQKFLAAALNTPISVMEESAAEGGAWGIALLAMYSISNEQLAMNNEQLTLEDFLNNNVFAGKKSVTIEPNTNDIDSFTKFMEKYVAGLEIEKSAVKNFN